MGSRRIALLYFHHTAVFRVLFDLEFPAGYTGNKDEMLAAMCQFVHEQDPKYSCVVKVEQSYASAAHEK